MKDALQQLTAERLGADRVLALFTILDVRRAFLNLAERPAESSGGRSAEFTIRS